MKRLTDLLALDPIYGRIFDILSLEGRLPTAEEIAVHEPGELDKPGNVLGSAWGDRDVWFRNYPPSFGVFTHELIHLAEKRSDVDEEVYAYDLSDFVVLLAERGIMPKANPLRLFEDVSLKDLAGAISSFYGIGGKNPTETLLNYFMLIGVIPLFTTLSEDGRRLLLNEGTEEKEIVIHSLVEIMDASLYDDENSLRLALEILNSKGARA